MSQVFEPFSKGNCGLCHRPVTDPFEMIVGIIYHPECAKILRDQIKEALIRGMKKRPGRSG